MQQGKIFKAEKYLEKDFSGENIKAVFMTIVGEDGEFIEFKNSMEFLNFMSERGYEMIEKNEESYVTFFTFKKK